MLPCHHRWAGVVKGQHLLFSRCLNIVCNMLSVYGHPSANSSRLAVAACQVLALLNAITGKAPLNGVQTEANC